MGRAALRKGAGKWLALFALALLGFYCAWVVAWSHQGEKLQPVVLGRDACHECGMVVSDIRQAVSVLDHDADGHPVTLQFDDVGCFLKFAREAEKKRGKKHWIGIAHDHRTGAEIPLDQARFVHPGGA